MVDIDAADIDELLSRVLKRVAEPGDPAGVADLIRSRVAAGDTGIPADGPQLHSGWSWIPWLGAGAVVAVVGATLGATGVFGAPMADPGASPATVSGGPSVSAGFCPGGSGAATLSAGERVLAVKRSDDSAWVAVRSPGSRSSLVWVPTSVVVADSGQSGIDSLPVDGCLEPIVTVAEEEPPDPGPAPTPGPQPGPTPRPAPQPGPQPPAGDTQAPIIQQAWATPTTLYSTESAVIHVLASDNVAVTGVNASWAGPDSGGAALTRVGSEWRLSYVFPASATSGTITFSLTARDAAGKVSAPQTVTITGIFFG